MKTINLTRRLGRYAKTLLVVSSLAIVTGCTSTSTMTIKREFQEKPELSRNNMTGTLQCMGNSLEGQAVKQAFVFMVRDLTDGTIGNHAYSNGPLSDAGRVQMIHALSNNTYPYLGVVTDTFPTVFRPISKENVGLNRFGIPSNANFGALNAVYGQVIRNARRSAHMPQGVKITPLIVSGSFTRYDTDNLFQDGEGHDLGSRSRGNDSDRRRGSGNIDYGKTDAVKAITLVVNIIDPRYNLVLTSQSFDLFFHQKNNSFRLRFALGDGFYGYSKNKVEVEGVHGAQQTLVDAAAIWVLNTAYGKQTDLSGCYDENPGYLTSTPKKKDLKVPASGQNGDTASLGDSVNRKEHMAG